MAGDFERVADIYGHPSCLAGPDGGQGRLYASGTGSGDIQDRIDRQVIAKKIEYAYNVTRQHGLSTPKLKV